MATTDNLQLNSTEMFAKIREALPQVKLTQNLLECKDDLLFAWDSNDCCLLVINWRAAQLHGHANVKYQTLIPSVPLVFVVDRVVASNEGSLIALAGPRGLMLLELPRRWGRNGQFMEGKQRITCRASNLDAHFFGNNPHLELHQVRWHPASPTDSHILALLSDNTIRVYDNTLLRHVWQVGPIPLKTEANLNSSFSAMMALGETAVDFDIAPAVTVSSDAPAIIANDVINSTAYPKQMKNVSLNESNVSTANKTQQQKSTEKVEWPLVILRNNGNIYILMTGFDTDKPRLQGPITITPQTSSNYGLDSCSLLVIPSLPPTLVIAESNGKLHHAVLLEAETAENSFNEIDVTINIYPSEYTAHVLETVELELGLPKEDENKEYNCPIQLKRDYINELRYFAYHNAGLHVITVNFIGELQRFVKSDVSSDISALSNPSRAEYLVCTKIDTSERVNAVLGFVLLQMPSGIVVLLGSGQVITLKLVIDPNLLIDPASKQNRALTQTENSPEIAELLRTPSFVDHIKNVLKRNVTQPIMSLDKSAGSPTTEICYELLAQAIEVLRTQYLKRHELARAEFTKRLNTIKMLKQQQQQDIEFLEKQRDEIREQAHRLAERFEEINDNQEVLAKKYQNLMRQANTCLPGNTLAEKEFSQEVERINKATSDMSQKVNKAKESIKKQWYHISSYNKTAKHKVIELPEKQERNIKEIILHMNTEIDGQIREIKNLKKAVGI